MEIVSQPRAAAVTVTLDGLRMAWKGQHINWHIERCCIIKLYSRVTGILVEEHSE